MGGLIETVGGGNLLVYVLCRTTHEWQNSLVVKRVFFEGLDCFMPLFYIAFYQLDVITLRAEIVSLFTSQSVSKLLIKLLGD